jgi:hypothetical protein
MATLSWNEEAAEIDMVSVRGDFRFIIMFYLHFDDGTIGNAGYKRINTI